MAARYGEPSPVRGRVTGLAINPAPYGARLAEMLRGACHAQDIDGYRRLAAAPRSRASAIWTTGVAPLASPSPSPARRPRPRPRRATLAPVCCPGVGPESAAIGAALPCPTACAKQTLADLAANDTVHLASLVVSWTWAPPFPLAAGSASIYLMSWFKNAPVPGPLVASNAANGGAVGRPSTVLFGSEPLNAGLQSSMQLNLGLWLEYETIVWTHQFFAARHYTNFSSGTSSSNVAMPYTDPVNGPSHSS